MVSVLVQLVFAVVAQADPPVSPDRPILGAIRWDAWHGPASEVGLTVERTLAPSHWHHRLPFYGRVVGENAVEARGNTQEIMDQEIAYAAAAGLDYWAFVIYPPEEALSQGLQLYLSSAKKDQVNFCLDLQGGWEARDGMKAWPDRIARYLSMFREPTYQTVLNGRPLVFLYSVEGLVGPGRFETWEEARIAFDQLRDAAADAGIPSPYIVAQGWWPPEIRKQVETLGLDAVGAYASNAGGKHAKYAELAAHTEHWWDSAKETGTPVVPLATAGWDMRPRVETPVPWVDGGDIEAYYEAPTPQELGAHVAKALTWCRENPAAAEAQAILIYAWNEFDEGGWICPTLSEGAARLDAIGEALRAAESGATAQKPTARPSLGAIRWDGHASVGSVGRISEQCLSLRAEFHDRAPFYGSIAPDGSVKLASDAPGVMAREASYARTAGLDYWAFLLYDDEAEPGVSDMGMEVGLEQYLALPDKQGLRFATIVGGHAMLKGLKPLEDRLIRYFRSPDYMRVADDRPLVYYFQAQDFLKEAETWRETIARLRERSLREGLGNPYVVGMCWTIDDGKAVVETLGFDAMGAYAAGMGNGRDGEPYTKLAGQVEQYWSLVKQAGVPYVPTAMVGNDDRPMIELPAPWMDKEKVEQQAEYARRYFAQGSPDEIAAHVRAAMDFAAANPGACPAGAVLVYSWMENIEGGWLVPTLNKDGAANAARVEALGEMVRAWRPAEE